MIKLNFRSGQDPKSKKSTSHTYMESDGKIYPMCADGYNRDKGKSFDIIRGKRGSEGGCKVCRKNLADGKGPCKLKKKKTSKKKSS